MPGEDFAETLKVVTGEVPGLPFVPELPARGPHAGMIGRTLGLITDLGADLQPDGWRIGVGEGLDQRRARSLLGHDLDVAEEQLEGLDGPLKVQVTGPLSLAAAVERPRGDKMLADHGARRELSEVLAAGLSAHLADLASRFSAVDLHVQVDEPGLQAVLQGSVPTASGWATHRSVAPPEADELLRRVVEVIRAAGATPVLHSCAADVPVALVRGAGFGAISFDLSLARPDDAWAEAFDAGTDLWFGTTSAARVGEFLHRLGFDRDDVDDRLVITPPCGLAGASPDAARAALRQAAST
jgi:methionine synthase II (cobalamin-independent)